MPERCDDRIHVQQFREEVACQVRCRRAEACLNLRLEDLSACLQLRQGFQNVLLDELLVGVPHR